MDVTATLNRVLAGRYSLERELGAGGMATVFLAHDLHNQRPVALKVLRPDLAALIGRDRFLSEIKITANLRHPHIMPLFDWGEVDGLLFYVMPYLEGETLRQRLNREGQLPVDDAVRIATAIAQGLDYAHRQDVIHRDLKPENILIQDNQPVIADFGIALAVRKAGGHRLTQTGISLGTPEYMSPEQATADERIDARADIYSLAAMLYEMLVGKPPHTGSSSQVIVAKLLTERPLRPRAVRETVPPHVEDAVLRGLAKRPADRFSSAAGFAQALAGTARPASSFDRVSLYLQRHPARVLAAAAVMVAIAAVTITMRNSPVDPSSRLIAVFPFRVRGGGDIAYLDDGMVDLLAVALRGDEGPYVVDPTELLDYVKSNPVTDPASARRVARHFSAGFFIMGSATAAGDRVRLAGSLYETESPNTPPIEASTVGFAANLFSLVDQLTARLLVGHFRGTPIDNIAATTTSSLPALRAYLEARRLQRSGQRDAAIGKFQEAVDLDSTFALAYLGISRVGESGQFQMPIPAATAAIRHMARLPKREQDIIRRQYMLVTGNDSTERVLREYLQRYPTDHDAWMSLGDWLFHSAPMRGTPAATALEALQKGWALDTAGFVPHALDLAGHAGRYQALDSILQRRPAGDTTWRGLVAFAYPDRKAYQQFFMEWLAQTNMESVTWVATVWPMFATNEGNERVLPFVRKRIQNDSMFQGRLVYAIPFLAGSGQIRHAHERLIRLGHPVPVVNLVLRANLTVLPFAPVDTPMLRLMQKELLSWDGVAPRGTFVTDSLSRRIRSYLLGMVALRLGDKFEALSRANELLAFEDSTPAKRAVSLDFASSLRAQVASVERRPDEVLRHLDSSDREAHARRYFFSYALTGITPFSVPTADRYVRASALIELNRLDEAFQWFDSFTEFAAPAFNAYPAISDLRRGQIRERQGKRDEAIRYYQHALSTWIEAEPSFKLLIDEAEAGLRRLGHDRTKSP